MPDHIFNLSSQIQSARWMGDFYRARTVCRQNELVCFNRVLKDLDAKTDGGKFEDRGQVQNGY